MTVPDRVPNNQQIHAQLDRIVNSAPFARSERLRLFLQFIVEARLRGETDQIQEYGIGLEVFGRLPSFDPRSDSIVRTEAHRLRRKLADYYDGVGQNDPLRIALPDRGYVPEFEPRLVSAPKVPADESQPARRLVPVTLAAAFIAIGVVIFGSYRWSQRPVTEPPLSSNRLAIEAFAKGRAARQQWTQEGAQQSIAFFQVAIAHDPDFALAHAWLSHAYRQRLAMGDARFDEVYPLAKAASDRALEIDSSLAQAHWSQGANLTWHYEWAAADRAFQRALELAPLDPAIHHAYAILCLAADGRLDEAETEIRKAAELEPASLSTKVILGKILYFRERYTEARTELEEALAINRNYPDAMRNLAAVLVQTGDFGEAVNYYHRAQSLSYLTWGDGLLAHAYAASGQRDQARNIVDKLLSESKTGKVSYIALATAYTGLGETDAALEWLYRSAGEHETRIRYVGVDPIYEPLRTEGRFDHLLRELGLASSRKAAPRESPDRSTTQSTKR